MSQMRRGKEGLNLSRLTTHVEGENHRLGHQKEGGSCHLSSKCLKL